MKVQLTKNAFAYVDKADYAHVKAKKWHLSSEGYAFTRVFEKDWREGSRLIGMHTFIMGGPRAKPFVVDHMDGNKLNNRRNNLRWVTYRTNNINQLGRSRSGVRGVYFNKSNKNWVAEMPRDPLTRKHFCLAQVKSFDKAVSIRKEWEKKSGLFTRGL